MATEPPTKQQGLERAQEMAQAMVARHYSRVSPSPAWKVGETHTLRIAHTFLPTHKTFHWGFASVDPWTALRGSEGEPEHYAVVQKDSQVEVLEVKCEACEHVSDDELTEEEKLLVSEAVFYTAPTFSTKEEVSKKTRPFGSPDRSSLSEKEGKNIRNAYKRRLKTQFAVDKAYPTFNSCVLHSYILPKGKRMKPFGFGDTSFFRRLHVRLEASPVNYVARVRVVKPVLASPGEDTGSYAPCGLPHPKNASFPIAGGPDYTGGYINEVTEGWISLGRAYPKGLPPYTWKVLGEPAAEDEVYL